MTARIFSIDSAIAMEEANPSPLVSLSMPVRYQLFGRTFSTRIEIWSFIKPAIRSLLRRHGGMVPISDCDDMTDYEYLAAQMVKGIFTDQINAELGSNYLNDGNIYLRIIEDWGPTNWNDDETYMITFKRSGETGRGHYDWLIQLIELIPDSYTLTADAGDERLTRNDAYFYGSHCHDC